MINRLEILFPSDLSLVLLFPVVDAAILTWTPTPSVSVTTPHDPIPHLVDVEQSPDRLIAYVLFDSIFVLINVSNDCL